MLLTGPLPVMRNLHKIMTLAKQNGFFFIYVKAQAKTICKTTVVWRRNKRDQKQL